MSDRAVSARERATERETDRESQKETRVEILQLGGVERALS